LSNRGPKPSPELEAGFALPHPALLDRLRNSLTDADYTSEFEKLKATEPKRAAFFILLAKEVAPEDLQLQEVILRAEIFGHLAVKQQLEINELELALVLGDAA
jgi:hypothetical protein